MIVRQASTCLRLVKHVKPHQQCGRNARLQRRFITTSTSTATPAASQSSASQIALITAELDKLSPRFNVPADSIQIIQSPSDFYETLKTKIRNAKKRIFLATLYVGKTEHELVATIHDALKRNPELKVSLLSDALRGTREAPDPSCASLLASLIRDFGHERVEVRVFHTPNLTGHRKAILPKRINEGWGLQHMKLYAVDDEIILSGANLSNDYFTNRQDRYHLFNAREVTSFFERLHQAVCSLSYRVIPSNNPSGFILDWPTSNAAPAPLINPKEYIAAATKVIEPLLKPGAVPSSDEEHNDTIVYPLVQLTPLLKPDTSTELPILTGVLRKLGSAAFAGSKWTFTAGYFNMTPEVRQLLLQSNPKSATVVAASPWANGFYGSKGVSGLLPAAYTLLSRRFLDAVSNAGLGDQISLKEWRRGTVNKPGGWTYHAKGIWITLPGQETPSISLIGSSNYTKRSYSLDLEANALIVTQNTDLQNRLGQEEKWLQEYATPMSRDDFAKTERRVGLHVRIAMWIVTLVGGAL